MSVFRWAVIALLLIGPGRVLAQGTAQTIMPPAPSGGYGPAEPIGNSGRPVPTGSFNLSPGPYTSPAARNRAIVVQPRRAR